MSFPGKGVNPPQKIGEYRIARGKDKGASNLEQAWNLYIVGVGNPEAGDDGLGPGVIERLRTMSLPCAPQLFDVGIDPLGMLALMDEAQEIWIVDTVRMKAPPGTVADFAPGEVAFTSSLGHSLHGLGLDHALQLARLLYKEVSVRVFGAEPLQTALGTGFSLEMTNALEAIIQVIYEQLRQKEQYGCGPENIDRG